MQVFGKLLYHCFWHNSENHKYFLSVSFMYQDEKIPSQFFSVTEKHKIRLKGGLPHTSQIIPDPRMMKILSSAVFLH